MTPTIAALVLTATTATTTVPRDLFLDYSACTKGREVCAAQRRQLRQELADCKADVAQPEAAGVDGGGYSLLEVVGVSAIVAVVAGGVALVVGVGVAR